MKSRLVVLIILAVLFQFNSIGWASELPSVTKVQTKRIDKTGIGRAELGERITLTVTNLETLVQEANESNKRIIPYLNGLPLADVVVLQENSQDRTLFFTLERKEGSKATWQPWSNREIRLLQELSLSALVWKKTCQSLVM